MAAFALLRTSSVDGMKGIDVGEACDGGYPLHSQDPKLPMMHLAERLTSENDDEDQN